MWAEGSEHPQGKKRGLDTLQPHGTKSWPSLPGGVSQGKGPLQGGLGKRLLIILARAGEGLDGVRPQDFGLALVPCLPFLQVWLETCLLSQLL